MGISMNDENGIQADYQYVKQQLQCVNDLKNTILIKTDIPKLDSLMQKSQPNESEPQPQQEFSIMQIVQ